MQKADGNFENLNFIFIPIPSAPSPSATSNRYKLEHPNETENSLLKSFHNDTTKSMPLSAISTQLYGTQSILLSSEKDITAKLSGIFELLSSPIEKFRLVQFLSPKDARGTIITKHQFVKYLYRYTGTDSVKSGTLRTMIDSIPLGKTTETPTEEFYIGFLSVLDHFWDECKLLKNANFQRIRGVSMIHNGQITIDDISIALDNLHQQRNESVRMDLMYPLVERIFDMMFMNSSSMRSGMDSTMNDGNKILRLQTNKMILSCIMNNSRISERHIFNALCPHPRGLASEIWSAKMNIWNVIYGIEFLKNHDINNWKKILDLTTPQRGNRRFKGKVETHDITKVVVSVEPGVPFSTMRCISLEGDTEGIMDKVCSFDENGKRDETQGFCIEEKLDGERCCLHLWRMKDGKIATKFYSRRGIIQPWYGSYVGDEKGIITKYMKEEQFEGIDSMILDGEMITFDEEKGSLLGFQDVKRCAEMLYKRQNVENLDLSDVKLYNALYSYDVVYYNGKSLQLTELTERKAILANIFQKMNSVTGPSNKFIKMHKWNIGYNEGDMKIAVDNVISKDSEGLVLKHLKSFYFVGKHSPRTIKLKPYYLKKFLDDLDVLIIGKEGSNYICALYGGDGEASTKEGDEYRHYFVSFCLVRNGFTTEFQQYIEDQTQGFWIPYKRHYSEIEMEEHKVKFGAKKPFHWIHPSDSVVINIKARNYVNVRDNEEQNDFLLTSHLRHPYCIGVRHDKAYNECDTVSGYYERVNNSINKIGLSSKYYGLRPSKKRRMPTKSEILLDKVNKGLVSKMDKIDNLFEGITFCVKSECYLKGEQTAVNVINGILESHGARLTTDPTQYRHGDHLMVIADIHTLSVKALNRRFNVYKFKWCEDSMRKESLVHLDPTHYLLNIDEEEMKLAYANINSRGLNSSVIYTDEMLWELSKKYGDKTDTNTPISFNEELQEALGMIFYNKTFAFLGYDNLPHHKEIIELEIEIAGGIILETLAWDNPPDYIVLEENISQPMNTPEKTTLIRGEELVNMCRK